MDGFYARHPLLPPLENSVTRVILDVYEGTVDGRRVDLYVNGQNISSDKYILKEEFSAVVVAGVTIDDTVKYQCIVLSTDASPSKTTRIYAYGKHWQFGKYY